MDESPYSGRTTDISNCPIDENGDCVIYWMQRSQRAQDNLALNFAAELANDMSKPLLVYFGMYDAYPMASVRAFRFMLEGLAETAQSLKSKGVGFVLRRECPPEGIITAASEFRACCVVVDQDYVRTGREWRRTAARRLAVRLVQVDADTVVPVTVSGKEEWGAYTLRPKILRVLDKHLIAVPDKLPRRKWRGDTGAGLDLLALDIPSLAAGLDVDQNVPPAPRFTGGCSEAQRRLSEFIEQYLPRYPSERNDIGVDVSSNLSPYLHFGQISPLRVALEVGSAAAPDDCVHAFLEQLIVRRELAINFCIHNERYDTMGAASAWARESLDQHRSDPRDELYSLGELEAAQTHDDLWNAAQHELMKSGKIHPYMRMVWAKNILGWSESPEEALARTVFLNDKYALDGRDPNGYANIAWCILGKHDRPFASRPVFGKIRYMTSEATKRKTNWRAYIERVNAL
jgi:deoxyribodipyrimidine photo-lyase